MPISTDSEGYRQYPCGPTTFVTNETGWQFMLFAYSCGYEEARMAQTSEAVKINFMGLFVTLLILVGIVLADTSISVATSRRINSGSPDGGDGFYKLTYM